MRFTRQFALGLAVAGTMAGAFHCSSPNDTPLTDPNANGRPDATPSASSSSGNQASSSSSSSGSSDLDASADAADAAPTIDRAACTGVAAGALALELTYDQAPNLAGGNLDKQGKTGAFLDTAENPRAGAISGRSELRFDDPVLFQGKRAEYSVDGNGASRYRAGDDVFYGFSLMLPAGWVDDGQFPDEVFKWHNLRDDGEQDKAPNMILTVRGRELVAQITSDATAISTAVSAQKEQVVLVPNLEFAATTWHDFVFHVVWGFEQTGLIEVWHKHKDDAGWIKVLSKNGPNLHNDTQAGYLKWGISKPIWLTQQTAVNARIVQHDEVRVGADFASVEPGCAR